MLLLLLIFIVSYHIYIELIMKKKCFNNENKLKNL